MTDTIRGDHELTAAAYADHADHTDHAPAAIGPYSQAVKSGLLSRDFVLATYIAGGDGLGGPVVELGGRAGRGAGRSYCGLGGNRRRARLHAGDDPDVERTRRPQRPPAASRPVPRHADPAVARWA